jgi:hypothetical protein
MSELREYFLLKQGKGGKWIQITKSYENTSLVEAAKGLTKQHPDINFGVADKDGIFIWQGKSAQKEGALTDE